jgi:hypothetical protein
MIPKETLQLIQETAQKAQRAAIVDVPGDGRHVYMQQGDHVDKLEVPPACRTHVVHSLAELIAYALNQANPKPIVWHGMEGVVLLTDDADRRDRVVFPLTQSARFKVLCKLAEETVLMQQAAFVKLLRIQLGLDNLVVVSKFRKLDWAVGNEGQSEVRHGADRLGKSITAKVQGIDELPEELDVPVPVYQQTGEREEYVVRCAIEIDAVNQRFQLVPLPDELERVMDLAQDSIGKRLAGGLDECKVPVYYGVP